MEKVSIHPTLEKIHVMIYNAIGHLTMCNYINHPSKFHENVSYKSTIDDIVLFHLFNHSLHFSHYQYFSWKLFIIEMSKILGGGTDKFSLKKLNNKLKNKCFDEDIDFSKQIQDVDLFFETNDLIIQNILDLRSSQFAHSDFKNNKIEIDFRESWKLIEEIKSIFYSFGSLFDYHYHFPDYGDFLSNMPEIEAYYNSVVNSNNAMDKLYLQSIVDPEYLKKNNLI